MLAELVIGAIFDDRYELLEELGSGGQSTVFKARQLDFDRTIALKIIRYSGFDDDDEKQRFFREASILSSLSHQNIVTIYHIGFCHDIPYIAMELISGESISRRLDKSGPISIDIAIDIIDQAASALEAVHAAGAIHRDIKPGNIILVDKPEPNTVKIIDFGLAKLDKPNEKLTQTGTLIGSAHYMSPEQCRAEKVDARTDIYSLTMCLFEMISGERPYDAESPMGIMYKQINDAIPQLPETTECDQKLNHFYQKGLAKEPNERFQTFAEYRAALAEIDPFKQSQKPLVAAGKSKYSPIALFLVSFTIGLIVVFAVHSMMNAQKDYSAKKARLEKAQQEVHHASARRKSASVASLSARNNNWVMINPWEAGTWKCISQKDIECYDLRTKKPQSTSRQRLVPGPWQVGHQLDSVGNIWHLEGLEDSERKGKNFRMERLSRVELEKPIRTSKSVHKHYKAVDQLIVTYGTVERKNEGVVSFDTIADISPLGSNKLKIMDRTIINPELDSPSFRRTESIWEREKPFEPVREKDGIDLKKSFDEFLEKKDKERTQP